MLRCHFRTICQVVLFFLAYELTEFIILKLISVVFNGGFAFWSSWWKLPFWLIVFLFIVGGSKLWKIDLFAKLHRISLMQTAMILTISVGVGVVMLVLFNWEHFFQNNFSIIFRGQELLTFNSLMSIMLLLIVAPILEESLFRGIMLEFLNRTNGVIISVLLSSLLFSIHHLTISQLFPSFLAGIYLGVLYYKTQSLSYSIIAHVSLNMVPVFIYV